MAVKGKRFILYHGDCRAVMAKMREESVDSIVCDPPYGLKFIGIEKEAEYIEIGKHRLQEIENATIQTQ